MKNKMIRGCIALLIVLIILTMPISFFVFIFTANSIETVYENLTEEHIKIIEESCNVSALHQANYIKITLFPEVGNYNIEIEFSLPIEDGEKYIQEGHNEWFEGPIRLKNKKKVNDDYYFCLSGVQSNGSPVTMMVRENGTKQEIPHALKGLLGICIYCIVLVILFKVLRKQKCKR